VGLYRMAHLVQEGMLMLNDDLLFKTMRGALAREHKRSYDHHCPICKELQDVLRAQRAQREARLARRVLAGACLVIALQWATIVWLIWFRRGC
jgi:ferric-dicitrate binding protein FerR (iron transport regulator)